MKQGQEIPLTLLPLRHRNTRRHHHHSTMHKQSLLLSISTLLTTTSALVASRQASGAISCDNGGANTIEVADIQALISDLNSNNVAGNSAGSFNLASTASLGQPSSGQVTVSSITVLVSNGQPFVSTHLLFTTVATALGQYQAVCCGSFSSCIGGSMSVAGDTGEIVSMKVSAA